MALYLPKSAVTATSVPFSNVSFSKIIFRTQGRFTGQNYDVPDDEEQMTSPGNFRLFQFLSITGTDDTDGIDDKTTLSHDQCDGSI